MIDPTNEGIKQQNALHQNVLRSVERATWQRPAPGGLGAMMALLILIFFITALAGAF